MLVIACCHLAR